MRLQERRRDGIIIVAIHGSMLIETADSFLDKINALTKEGPALIALDFKDCPLIDGYGLGIMARAHMAVSRARGTLVLLHLSKQVHELLAVVKLLSVFEEFGSEEKAVRALKRKGGMT